MEDGDLCLLKERKSGRDSGQIRLGLINLTMPPGQPPHDTAGVTSLYAAAGDPVESLIPIAYDRLKVVVAQGGDAKVGTFNFWVG